MARGGVDIELDIANLRAVLSQGNSQVVITGQAVRVLAIYADARAGDEAGEGWLSAAAAWAAWDQQGNSGDAPIEVVSWERTRLRQRLARAQVGSVEELFDRRKEGAYVVVRLGSAVREVTISRRETTPRGGG